MPHQLNIVLVEPEIPNNTGSIGRLCLATGSELHLVEPLGFEINDRQLKRAGLDYWRHLKVKRHKSLDDLFNHIPEKAQKLFFSTKAKKAHYECEFEEGSYLFFGKETKGLSAELREANSDDVYKIPQYDDRVRSINLATAVGVILYEAIRQLGH